MPSRIHRPYMRHLPTSQSSSSRKVGRGGSVLLGGVGAASSYVSPDDYMETTGRQLGKGLYPMSSGSGLYPMMPSGKGLGLGMTNLTKKLESLNVAPKKEKAKNIRFNL